MSSDPGCLAALVTEHPLEGMLIDARSDVITEAMGALVVFEGVVRNHDGGRRVASLTYSAHPTAPDTLTRVAELVAAAHPKTRLWTAHRTGALSIGEDAFVVLAAAAHRAEAFAACSDMADRVKAEVPIWKEQALIDGPVTWVGVE